MSSARGSIAWNENMDAFLHFFCTVFDEKVHLGLLNFFRWKHWDVVRARHCLSLSLLLHLFLSLYVLFLSLPRLFFYCFLSFFLFVSISTSLTSYISYISTFVSYFLSLSLSFSSPFSFLTLSLCICLSFCLSFFLYLSLPFSFLFPSHDVFLFRYRSHSLSHFKTFSKEHLILSLSLSPLSCLAKVKNCVVKFLV
jgi:hypothetical protein